MLTGNLPYYVATPIISRFVLSPQPFSHAVFLIQKEVAERITAKPGTRDFGYFSVECQLLADVQYLFSVAPGAFRPAPKVDSAVIRLTPRSPIAVEKVEGFLQFASRCFRQKRKTLRNNLAGSYQLPALPQLSQRAEQLSVAELIELYAAVSEPRR